MTNAAPKSASSVTHRANSTSRYYVRIDGVAQAVFSEVSGLQLETELFEYVEGGNSGFVYRLPGQTKAGNVTLKRGIVKGNDLFKWYQHIIQGKMDLRTVEIQAIASEGSSIATWRFERAFPCKWSGPQMTAGTDSVAVETFELAHMGVITLG